MSDEADPLSDAWRTVTIVVVMLVALIIATLLVGETDTKAWCEREYKQITRDQQQTGSGQDRRLHDWTEICG